MCEADRGTFEWVTSDWHTLGPLLAPDRLELRSDARVVDVGCGTSLLPVQLATMYSSVVGIDREAHCAQSMLARYGDRDELRWLTADLAHEDFDHTLLPFECASLVVDKGTLDCALTEDTAAPLLRNILTLLATRGVYAVVSFRKPELLAALMTCPGLPWTVESCQPLPSTVGGAPAAAASLCLMRQNGLGEAVASVEEIQRHLNSIMDHWYTQQSPLLTPERERVIRNQWSAALTALQKSAAGKGMCVALCIGMPFTRNTCMRTTCYSGAATMIRPLP